VKALAIKEKVLGTKHPSTVRTLEYLEDIYEQSGNPVPFEDWLKGRFQE
jgi:hypothetical protein